MKALAFVLGLLVAAPAAAQNWSFDARQIGMGAAGTGNVLMRTLDDDRGYRAIVLPLGLSGEDLLARVRARPAPEYLVVHPDGSPAGILATADLVAALKGHA